jgi:nitrate reductase NapAB chaperone NapD
VRITVFPLRPVRKAGPAAMPVIAAVLAVFALSASSHAYSCPSSALYAAKSTVCAVPEAALRKAAVNSAGFTLTPQGQSLVLIYNDSTHTLLSDVVRFANVTGIVTVAFVFEADGAPLRSRGLPILGAFTEANKPIFVSLALKTGQFLNATVCSEAGRISTCPGASESAGLTIGTTSIPEPGTFVMVLSGVMGTGAWRLSAGSRARRLFKQKIR